MQRLPSAPYICLLLCLALGCGAREIKVPAGEASKPAQLEEKVLSIELARNESQLLISIRDEGAPVRTDVWLYTLENGQLKAFTAFKDPDSKRKSRRFMLPATIAGQPSGLAPADNGDENGFMTDGVRDKRVSGATTSAIDGDVAVTLDSTPTSPLVVVAAIEDQRYAGAAGIDASGTLVVVPSGIGVPKTHVARRYETDVKPILRSCTECHAQGAEAEGIRLVTYDELVNLDIAFGEGQDRCAKQHAGDDAARDACVNAIVEVEYLVEPGAPALSPVARRTRPDEERNASSEGLKWFGKGGKRFGGHGDRRMPPENTTEVTSDDRNESTHFDAHPQDFQVLFDWIAQGARP